MNNKTIQVKVKKVTPLKGGITLYPTKIYNAIFGDVHTGKAGRPAERYNIILNPSLSVIISRKDIVLI